MLFTHKPSRPTPFRRGRRYRVLQDFTPRYGHPFKTGQIVTFRSTATSVYDGMDGYFFTVAGEPPTANRWDVSFDDHIAVWVTLFGPLPRGPAWWATRAALLILVVALLAVWTVHAESARILLPGPIP